MESTIPEGWTQDSHTLYLHSSGVRIERRVYRSKEGWVLVPVDLDRAVVEFAPNSDGLGQAFAAFAEGVLGPAGSVPQSKGREAQEAARRDETPDAASDDEEKEKDEEDDD
jgi:hypothetical protein